MKKIMLLIFLCGVCRSFAMDAINPFPDKIELCSDKPSFITGKKRKRTEEDPDYFPSGGEELNKEELAYEYGGLKRPPKKKSRKSSRKAVLGSKADDLYRKFTDTDIVSDYSGVDLLLKANSLIEKNSFLVDSMDVAKRFVDLGLGSAVGYLNLLGENCPKVTSDDLRIIAKLPFLKELRIRSSSLDISLPQKELEVLEVRGLKRGIKFLKELLSNNKNSLNRLSFVSCDVVSAQFCEEYASELNSLEDACFSGCKAVKGYSILALKKLTKLWRLEVRSCSMINLEFLEWEIRSEQEKCTGFLALERFNDKPLKKRKRVNKRVAKNCNLGRMGIPGSVL